MHTGSKGLSSPGLSSPGLRSSGAGSPSLGGTSPSSSEPRVGASDGANDAPPSGFAGRLDGATVADLVQLECAAGRTRAIKVQSRGRTGYLCFEAGALVHAIAPGAVGDAAVMQILGWQDGAFEPAKVRWPATPSVRSSWQHLVLSAAHAADEAARGKVVELRAERTRHGDDAISGDPVSQVVDHPTLGGDAPRGARLTTATRTARPPEAEGRLAAAALRTPGEVQAVEPMQESSLDLGLNEPAPLRRLITQAVRLDATGRVVAARGEVEQFSGVVAYGKRLGDLIGEALGAGKLRALKCTTRDRQTLVYEEESGSVVGISAAASSNLSSLDGKLGL